MFCYKSPFSDFYWGLEYSHFSLVCFAGCFVLVHSIEVPAHELLHLDPWKTDSKDQASRVSQEHSEFDAWNCLLVATLRKIWFLWSQGKTVQPQACNKWCLINDSKKLPLCVCFCDCSIRHQKVLGGISRFPTGFPLVFCAEQAGFEIWC